MATNIDCHRLEGSQAVTTTNPNGQQWAMCLATCNLLEHDLLLPFWFETGLWPSWCIAILLCGRFSSWSFRFVAASVCGHIGSDRFGMHWFVVVSVCGCFGSDHLGVWLLWPVSSVNTYYYWFCVNTYYYWFCVQEHSLCKIKHRPKYLGGLFALFIYLYWQHTTVSMQSFNVLRMLWYPSWKWLKNKIGFSTWSTSAHYENMTRFIFCSSLVDYIGSDSPYNWHGYLMVILLLSNCWSR